MWFTCDPHVRLTIITCDPTSLSHVTFRSFACGSHVKEQRVTCNFLPCHMWKSIIFHMWFDVVTCDSHVTRMWGYRLSHAVLPLFHMCYSHFRMWFTLGLHVTLLHVTCEKPNVWHVIHTGFTCESHVICQYITCELHGYFVCDMHVNHMCFTCGNTCFHMWTVIFLFSHVKTPVYHVTNIPRSHVNIGLSHVMIFFSYVIRMCFTWE